MSVDRLGYRQFSHFALGIIFILHLVVCARASCNKSFSKHQTIFNRLFLFIASVYLFKDDQADDENFIGLNFTNIEMAMNNELFGFS